MVPERPRVRDLETVVEAFAGRDRLLGEMRHAIHGVGDAQPMPVHQRRLRQLVDQPDLELLAALRPQGWARHGAVVAPDRGRGLRLSTQQRGARPRPQDAEPIRGVFGRGRLGVSAPRQAERDQRGAYAAENSAARHSHGEDRRSLLGHSRHHGLLGGRPQAGGRHACGKEARLRGTASTLHQVRFTPRRSRHFFRAAQLERAISPAARPQPQRVERLSSGGRGGTGRRAGFRFQ